MAVQASRKLVGDMMVSDVVTISCMATLRQAMEMMRDRGVKSLVVEKRHDHDAWGIVTYTTILRTVVQEEGDVDLINVYDIASKPAVTVPRQLEVRHAVQMMLDLDIKRVIVSSNNELEGILTMHDIVSAILEKVED
ncbi:MAG: CBS domain-containing protein [Wenzhouxiangella sp.]|jgi:signal-transduction protein with cAMP-binding, CBS, and nucleotidyltransferase domain|nr:CBS domain-containing protein [Wenzhouxiangella sp.]